MARTLDSIINIANGFCNLFGRQGIDTTHPEEVSQMKRLESQLKTELNSINKEARSSTFDFPIFFSDSLNMETVFDIKEALEQKYAVLLKLYIESVGVLNIDRDDNKKYFINRMKNMLEETTSEANLEFFPDDLNEKDVDGCIIHEAPTMPGELTRHQNRDRRSGRFRPGTHYDRDEEEIYEHRFSRYQQQRQEFESNRTLNSQNKHRAWQRQNAEKQFEYQKEKDAKEEAYKREKDAKLDAKNAREEARANQQIMENLKMQAKHNKALRIGNPLALVASAQALIDRKNIGMAPTIINVDIEYYTAGGNIATTHMSIGVKCHPILVKSESILKNLPKARFEENFWIRLSRVLTGEKGFFKDLLLRVDLFKGGKPKDDRWYWDSKRYTSMDKLESKFSKNKKFANASLVISIDEMEEMRRESNFDMIDEKKTVRMMDALGFINVFVVDEPRERVMRIDDSYKRWNTTTFATIQKENKQDDRKMLKLVLAAQGIR